MRSLLPLGCCLRYEVNKRPIYKINESPDFSGYIIPPKWGGTLWIVTGTLLGYRDRVIMEVFYSTGIRRKELINLKLSDVNYPQGYLRINQGKGNKDRVVPLGSIACKYLENYIKGVRPELCGHNHLEELFISRRHGPINPDSIGHLINKYRIKAGIKKRVGSHTFRHTVATHLVRNRANLRHVQEILGHKSLNTTQKYIQLTITDLKEAHRKYHPREQEAGKERKEKRKKKQNKKKKKKNN